MDTKKELEVIYVEMPISTERKKEYNRRGYRVVDARFAPKGYQAPFELELAAQNVSEGAKQKRASRGSVKVEE